MKHLIFFIFVSILLVSSNTPSLVAQNDYASYNASDDSAYQEPTASANTGDFTMTFPSTGQASTAGSNQQPTIIINNPVPQVQNNTSAYNPYMQADDYPMEFDPYDYDTYGGGYGGGYYPNAGDNLNRGLDNGFRGGAGGFSGGRGGGGGGRR
jgi:hypothetical protein